jgi:hypothetical protein
MSNDVSTNLNRFSSVFETLSKAGFTAYNYWHQLTIILVRILNFQMQNS